MFSFANKAIYSRLFLTSTFCNVVRQQPLQCLRSKEPIALSAFVRPYINNHGSYKLSSFSKEKLNVMALDENEKEIGVVKFSRLKSLAVERGMVVEMVDKEALPHPIYKLVPAKESTHEGSDNAPKKVKAKEHTKEKVKKVHKKLLRLKPTINKNDLKVKIDHVLEWLVKGCIVNVRIAIIPDDKRHMQVYEEIVRTAGSVATISKSTTNDKEIVFELTSSTSSEGPLDNPLEQPPAEVKVKPVKPTKVKAAEGVKEKAAEGVKEKAAEGVKEKAAKKVVEKAEKPKKSKKETKSADVAAE